MELIYELHAAELVGLNLHSNCSIVLALISFDDELMHKIHPHSC